MLGITAAVLGKSSQCLIIQAVKILNIGGNSVVRESFHF
jgi:hypothetical protein